MLFDGMFIPEEQADGSFNWENPAGKFFHLRNLQLRGLLMNRPGLADGEIPLIALDDVGAYSLWIFDNPSESAGLDLEVATDQVSFD